MPPPWYGAVQRSGTCCSRIFPQRVYVGHCFKLLLVHQPVPKSGTPPRDPRAWTSGFLQYGGFCIGLQASVCLGAKLARRSPADATSPSVLLCYSISLGPIRSIIPATCWNHRVCLFWRFNVPLGVNVFGWVHDSVGELRCIQGHLEWLRDSSFGRPRMRLTTRGGRGYFTILLSSSPACLGAHKVCPSPWFYRS